MASLLSYKVDNHRAYRKSGSSLDVQSGVAAVIVPASTPRFAPSLALREFVLLPCLIVLVTLSLAESSRILAAGLASITRIFCCSGCLHWPCRDFASGAAHPTLGALWQSWEMLASTISAPPSYHSIDLGFTSWGRTALLLMARPLLRSWLVFGARPASRGCIRRVPPAWDCCVLGTEGPFWAVAMLRSSPTYCFHVALISSGIFSSHDCRWRGQVNR